MDSFLGLTVYMKTNVKQMYYKAEKSAFGFFVNNSRCQKDVKDISVLMDLQKLKILHARLSAHKALLLFF